MHYLNYRCESCGYSNTMLERTDHKCPKCNSKMIRRSHSDKRLEKARLELQELANQENT